MRSREGPRIRPQTVVAIVLLALGGSIFVAAGLHYIENQFSVVIAPSQGGSWRVLVPRPIVPMSLEITGEGITSAPTETPYGTMENITGTGEAVLRYTLQRFEFRLTRFDPSDSGRFFVDLTGRVNASAFMVRMESQEVANANVTGVGSWVGIHLGSGMSCGGPAFIGDVFPGWNVVPAIASDCVIGFDAIPWLELIAPGFVVAGSVVLVRAFRHSRGGER